MHILWTVLLAGAAILWIVAAVELTPGLRAMPSLDDAVPLADSECPAVSVLFAARDEAANLPGALATFLALDYPRYEVVAVDDRSEDATGAILESAACADARLKAVRVDSLPSGWLGKPHALQEAYEHSTGEWLVFTDADVHFAPGLLRRALRVAQEQGWDHMPLLGAPKMFTAGEKIAMTFFGVALMAGTRPWSAMDPLSGGYAGVGAFQLVRRSAYEKLGTHRRLAMEVIDDMKLGKLAKQAGVRSGIAKAGAAVSVHWHVGLGNLVRGTTKNFFAASRFKLRVAALHIFGMLVMCILPAMSLPFVHGWTRVVAAVAAGVPLVIAGAVAREFKISPAWAFTYPVGALIFVWMLTRSAIVTLWQGGIVWRGTFYPLEELKRGLV